MRNKPRGTVLKSDRSYFFADQKNGPERLHNLLYNIARVLAPYKSYWATMNKIFIYARSSVNKMTWPFFFTWLQIFLPVKLQCSFPSLLNIEETSEELPNLGPHPTSNKNKAEKTCKLHVSGIFLDNFGSLTCKIFFSDTWVLWLWFSPFSP